jgi:hypothetical protein
MNERRVALAVVGRTLAGLFRVSLIPFDAGPCIDSAVLEFAPCSPHFLRLAVAWRAA